MERQGCSIAWCFSPFSFCSGCKHRSAYGLNRCMRHLRGCDKLNGTTANWFKSTRSTTGTTWYQHDVSAYHSPLSSRTPHQHVKTRHTVNGKPAFVRLPTQATPEDYLVRHEIITPHLVATLGRAASHTTQIRVGGLQTVISNQSVSPRPKPRHLRS
jgi:hypothetical protein